MSATGVVDQEFVRRETDDGFVMIREVTVTPPFAETVGEQGRADPAAADVEFAVGVGANVSVRGSIDAPGDVDWFQVVDVMPV